MNVHRSSLAKHRVTGLVLGAVVLLGVSGCVGGADEPEPSPAPPLTTTEAGRAYLDAVCPVNEAWDAADLEVDRLRSDVDHRGDAAETEDFSAAMDDVAEASEAAAESLDPKTKGWPDEALEPIDEVRDTLAADAEQARTVAKLDAEKAARYAWEGAAETGEAANRARAALGLPDDAELACAQWKDE